LKQENQRLTSQIQQANKKINGLADEIDELKGQLGEYKKIKGWAEDNAMWDELRANALNGGR